MIRKIIRAAHAALFASVMLICPAVTQAQTGTTAPPRTIAGVLELLGQFKPEPGRAEAMHKKLAEAPPPDDSPPRTLYQFYFARAWAAQQVGATTREIADFRKAVEIAANMGGPEIAESLITLSNALAFAGNYLEGLRVRERILRATVSSSSALMPNVGLVSFYVTLGERDEARKALARAESLYADVRLNRNLANWWEFYAGGIAMARGRFLAVERKYESAEAAFRQGSEAMQRDQPNARIRAASPPPHLTSESILEVSARNWEVVDVGLAETLIARDRFGDAELVIRGALERALKRLGRANVFTAGLTAILSSVLYQQGRFREAEQITVATLAIFDEVRVVPESIVRAKTLRVLGSNFAAQGRWDEALRAYEKMRDGLARDPESLQYLGNGEFNWALALVKTGRAADAVALIMPQVERVQELYGAAAPQTALLRGVLAMALAKQGQGMKAREEFEQAMRVLLAARPDDSDPSPARALEVRRVLEGYIEFLFQLQSAPPAERAGLDPAAEAFGVADVLRGQSVQRALGQSAARAAVNDPTLAVIVRKEQDLEQEMRSLYAFLANQLNVPPDRRLPNVIASMQKRIEQIRSERRELLAGIQKQFPRYAELVNPQPASLDAVRKALGPGEALVSVLTTEDRTFIWAVNGAGQTGVHSAPIGEKAIAGMVATLRRALDPGDREIPPFDFATSYQLYSLLLGPLAEVWGGSSTLVVAASGALAQLPLSVLVTENRPLARDPKQPFGEYRGAPWLARKVAISYTPSVNAFLGLRSLPAVAKQREAFAGFGDPQFSPTAVAVAGGARGLRLRSLQIERVTRDVDPSRQAVAWPEYQNLTPLPDTRDEILSIAKVLGANPERDVFLGLAANVQKVRQTELANRRVVMFATHGLVPGDLPGLDKPALALSPTGNPKESPLLRLEDVLSLKLDADLVVLSACNTAAADGEGAEAISGLGRGFFYAGSRALLVTHWPVETVSAKLLTMGFFERYVSSAAQTRVRALHDSMLALIDSPGTPQYSYAHPLFWAPYALIGDPGR